MLARSNRLLTSDEFRNVFRRGKKRTIAGGVVAFVNSGHHSNRWGFVVPKAVGSAVVRNRVKRRLRAAASVIAPAVGNVDVVVRATQDAPTLSVDQWASELVAILGQEK